MTRLESTIKAPGFSLVNQKNETVSLSDFLGKKVVVYFYPAASTPGCTTQACDFRDNMASLKSAGYVVIGISKDDIPALVSFSDTEGLEFSLLSDPGLSVHLAYGAFGEKSLYGKTVTGVIRSTFVVDENGHIEHAFYNVKATGHVAALRKKLGI